MTGIVVSLDLIDNGRLPGYFGTVQEIAGLFGALVLWAAYVTGIPVIGLIGLARLSKAPRGWIDAAIGGIPGYIAAIAALVFWLDPAYHNGTAADSALLALLLLLPGWLAGLVYWLAAGRPQPPY